MEGFAMCVPIGCHSIMGPRVHALVWFWEQKHVRKSYAHQGGYTCYEQFGGWWILYEKWPLNLFLFLFLFNKENGTNWKFNWGGLNNRTYYCGNFIVQVLVKGRRVLVEAHFRVKKMGQDSKGSTRKGKGIKCPRPLQSARLCLYISRTFNFKCQTSIFDYMIMKMLHISKDER
jgi:hypothetical protein